MAEHGQKSDIKLIPVKDIVIEHVQVRKENVAKDVKELEDSIRTVGLLQPIVVYPAQEPGKFELIAGQRRLSAVRALGWKNIPAVAFRDRMPREEALALSLTENMMRNDLSHSDYVDVCTTLYNKYLTFKAVCEKTGLPYQKVKQYVGYAQLIVPLKKMCDDGLDIIIALRAQEAGSVSGETDVDATMKFAKLMKSQTKSVVKAIVEQRRSNPDLSPEEAMKEALVGSQTMQVKIVLGPAASGALTKCATARSSSVEDTAAELVETQLKADGLLK